MKVVIEIPDETFNRLRELAEMNVFSDNSFGYSLLAIAHGQVVPDSLQGWKYEERTQGEWGKWIIAEIQCPNCFEYFETDCYSTEELNKCPNCGAAMHKPNCVRCDHFGKCEGCEKGEEE